MAHNVNIKSLNLGVPAVARWVMMVLEVVV